MKVKELIQLLQTMPQDAEVFSYTIYDECDASIDKVKLVSNPLKAYYCKGDSVAGHYMANNQNETHVVVLSGAFPYYGNNWPEYDEDEDEEDEEDEPLEDEEKAIFEYIKSLLNTAS